MQITPEIDKRADEIIAEYPKKKSAAMMLMHLMQETFGFFDDDAIKYIADKLSIEPIEVYGMMSFYPMFTKEKNARIHIKVCRTLSCALAGSINLADAISKELDMPMNSTKGIYTLEFVECLGNCVKGPNVQVNDKLFDSVTPDKAGKFLEQIKAMDAAGELNPATMHDAPQGAGDFDNPAYKG